MASEAAEVAQRCEAGKENGQLDLSDCKLTKFPDGIFMLMQSAKVVTLKLDNNQLTTISPKIPQRWNDLTDLSVSGNQLSALPPDTESLSSLRSLTMARNQYNHIPLVVYSLRGLERLDASNNKIEKVAAEELKSMEALKYVDLRENPLSDALKSQLKERDDWELMV